jgi:hypothetical protein
MFLLLCTFHVIILQRLETTIVTTSMVHPGVSNPSRTYPERVTLHLWSPCFLSTGFLTRLSRLS